MVRLKAFGREASTSAFRDFASHFLIRLILSAIGFAFNHS